MHRSMFSSNIDLTTSYGYCGLIDVPLRPPSPFADDVLSSRVNAHALVDRCFAGADIFQMSTINHSQEALHTPTKRARCRWRRTLNRILRRGENDSRTAR
jgi:hypothetical protein